MAGSAKDIINLKRTFGEAGRNIKIIAKIDTITGLENFEQILNEADGMIFCRNELGWELSPEKTLIA